MLHLMITKKGWRRLKMKSTAKPFFYTFFGIFFFVTLVLGQQQDVPGSKDHPLLTRMPNFYISGYTYKKFDQADFKSEKGENIVVEGQKYHIEYEIKENQKSPSELQILKNYENAVKKIGGVTVFQAPGEAWLKVKRDGQMAWIYVYAHCDGGCYELDIVEKKGMEQEVVADAKSLAQDISSTGHASVYGIHFDVDKATVKSESGATLKEIAILLKQNPGLKLYVVGHTDNVGKIEYNMKLSHARADAVVKALVTEYGTDLNQLNSYGVGPLSPVASNRTEEGRAKNRRVELVQE
jgi:OOP family OmpA-OmpF porin